MPGEGVRCFPLGRGTFSTFPGAAAVGPRQPHGALGTRDGVPVRATRHPRKSSLTNRCCFLLLGEQMPCDLRKEVLSGSLGEVGWGGAGNSQSSSLL